MDAIELLKKTVGWTIAERYSSVDMNYHVWDWHQGVALYGLRKAYDVTGDELSLVFLREYAEYHLARGLGPRTINTTIPVVALLDLYTMTGDYRYAAVCRDRADYCMAEAPRTASGALAHTVIGKDFSSQIWADTLFMGALFLARWGSFTGETLYQKEAARQLLLHYKYLRDSRTGLLFHGYDDETRSHLSSVCWGRANGWGIISSVDILESLPLYFPERIQIIQNLEGHLHALSADQAPSGHWHTVLDHPETYEESTVAACLSYGIRKGIRLGFVDTRFKRMGEAAHRALVRSIGDEGRLLGASGGTPIMDSVEAYGGIPTVPSYYAQGLALMALAAAVE